MSTYIPINALYDVFFNNEKYVKYNYSMARRRAEQPHWRCRYTIKSAANFFT